jgi:hypothetical protein
MRQHAEENGAWALLRCSLNTPAQCSRRLAAAGTGGGMSAGVRRRATLAHATQSKFDSVVGLCRRRRCGASGAAHRNDVRLRQSVDPGAHVMGARPGAGNGLSAISANIAPISSSTSSQTFARGQQCDILGSSSAPAGITANGTRDSIGRLLDGRSER